MLTNNNRGRLKFKSSSRYCSKMSNAMALTNFWCRNLTVKGLHVIDLSKFPDSFNNFLFF